MQEFILQGLSIQLSENELALSSCIALNLNFVDLLPRHTCDNVTSVNYGL